MWPLLYNKLLHPLITIHIFQHLLPISIGLHPLISIHVLQHLLPGRRINWASIRRPLLQSPARAWLVWWCRVCHWLWTTRLHLVSNHTGYNQDCMNYTVFKWEYKTNNWGFHLLLRAECCWEPVLDPWSTDQLLMPTCSVFHLSRLSVPDGYRHQGCWLAAHTWFSQSGEWQQMGFHPVF